MATMHERMARYKRVVHLRLCGWTPNEIARDVGLSDVRVHGLIHEAFRQGDLPHCHRVRPPDLTEEELRIALERERAASKSA